MDQETTFSMIDRHRLGGGARFLPCSRWSGKREVPLQGVHTMTLSGGAGREGNSSLSDPGGAKG